jgi:hypothetical protein
MALIAVVATALKADETPGDPRAASSVPSAWGSTTSADDPILERSSAALGQTVTVDLAVFDRVHLSKQMRQRIIAETDSILLELGAHLLWQDGPSGYQAYVPTDAIQIILSKSRPERWGLPPNIMGEVVPTGERSRKLVFVFPAEVARLVGLPAPLNLPYRATESRRLARALGRVIAHELVHAIAPDHTHATDGIMLGRHGTATLLDPELKIDASCKAAFKAGLGAFDSSPQIDQSRQQIENWD